MVTLPIGTRLDASPDVSDLTPTPDPVELQAARFNRHTFWCGQSGSGKTYALGVVLEQLLLRTELPLLVLDPNGDFTRIAEPHPRAPAPEAATAIAEKDLRVLHTTRPGGSRLHCRFTDLSTAAKAAVLRLDPILDAEEYNVLLHFDRETDAVRNVRGWSRPACGPGDLTRSSP